MDILSTEKRSWNMSRIRGKDTKPELAVRSTLHQMGYRFRLHPKELPGKPDIILPKYRTAIFVHGCFWHRHPDCKFSYEPKSKQKFWTEKFDRNVIRHKKVASELEQLGWNVIVIWECEISNMLRLKEKLSLH